MQYKTIVLQLLEQHPELYHPLRKSRQLPPTLDRYAQDLKDSHELWKAQLSRATPQSDPSQIASEALEFALKELENRLLTGLHPNEDEPLSSGAVMAFIRRPTPPA